MEMSEAKREKCGNGRSGNEEERGEMRENKLKIIKYKR
jgi:hypothetical protein